MKSQKDKVFFTSYILQHVCPEVHKLHQPYIILYFQHAVYCIVFVMLATGFKLSNDSKKAINEVTKA